MHRSPALADNRFVYMPATQRLPRWLSLLWRWC
jgi:hypothetical protein